MTLYSLIVLACSAYPTTCAPIPAETFSSMERCEARAVEIAIPIRMKHTQKRIAILCVLYLQKYAAD